NRRPSPWQGEQTTSPTVPAPPQPSPTIENHSGILQTPPALAALIGALRYNVNQRSQVHAPAACVTAARETPNHREMSARVTTECSSLVPRDRKVAFAGHVYVTRRNEKTRSCDTGMKPM